MKSPGLRGKNGARMRENKMEAPKEPDLGGNWAHFAWRKVATTKFGNFEVECGHHSRITAPTPTKFGVAIVMVSKKFSTKGLRIS
jgi:hypothetical protein